MLSALSCICFEPSSALLSSVPHCPRAAHVPREEREALMQGTVCKSFVSADCPNKTMDYKAGFSQSHANFAWPDINEATP